MSGYDASIGSCKIFTASGGVTRMMKFKESASLKFVLGPKKARESSNRSCLGCLC